MPRVKGEGKMIFIVIGECCINVDKAKKIRLRLKGDIQGL